MLGAMERRTDRLSGRRRQAASNDERILDAAREVFVADPGAPISAVAAHAGVGISALYRRYPSKEDLLRTLCRDGLRLYVEEAERAVEDEGDAWQSFADFVGRIVDADVHSLTVSLAGTFMPTDDMTADAARAEELNRVLVDRAKAVGALREDFEVTDLALILEQLAAVTFGDEARRRELRRRYLALQLDGLRATGASPLPGRPPTADEIGGRWVPRSGGA